MVGNGTLRFYPGVPAFRPPGSQLSRCRHPSGDLQRPPRPPVAPLVVYRQLRLTGPRPDRGLRGRSRRGDPGPGRDRRCRRLRPEGVADGSARRPQRDLGLYRRYDLPDAARPSLGGHHLAPARPGAHGGRHRVCRSPGRKREARRDLPGNRHEPGETRLRGGRRLAGGDRARSPGDPGDTGPPGAGPLPGRGCRAYEEAPHGAGGARPRDD